MALVGNTLRRTFGPFYWVPVPLGVLILIYSGVCIQAFWEKGSVGMLLMALWSVSCEVTLISLETRNYVVAILDLLIAVAIAIPAIRGGQPIFLYLTFTSLILAGSAAVPRKRSDNHQISART